jgi:lysophospholipase L1-like esterase
MKRVFFLVRIFSLLLVFVPSAQAQDAPFYNEIIEFKQADSTLMPAPNAVLFVGSSSIRMWNDLQKDFPGKTIINRGFGGSSTPHVIQYADDIIFLYNPKQIVIYVGENDFTSTPPATPFEVANRIDSLIHLIRTKLPQVPIVYISIKPSISRLSIMPQMKEANKLIKERLSHQKNIVFVDVFSKMLDENGKPMKDIFLADNLHMNVKGYAIWKKALEPYLNN